MTKKDKHIRIYEPILTVMDEYANKTLRTKSVVYEMALKEYIKNKKEEFYELGISSELLSKAINSNSI